MRVGVRARVEVRVRVGFGAHLLERGHGGVAREAVACHDGLRVHLLLDELLRLPEELACLG